MKLALVPSEASGFRSSRLRLQSRATALWWAPMKSYELRGWRSLEERPQQVPESRPELTRTSGIRQKVRRKSTVAVTPRNETGTFQGGVLERRNRESPKRIRSDEYKRKHAEKARAKWNLLSEEEREKIRAHQRDYYQLTAEERREKKRKYYAAKRQDDTKN